MWWCYLALVEELGLADRVTPSGPVVGLVRDGRLIDIDPRRPWRALTRRALSPATAGRRRLTTGSGSRTASALNLLGALRAWAAPVVNVRGGLDRLPAGRREAGERLAGLPGESAVRWGERAATALLDLDRQPRRPTCS